MKTQASANANGLEFNDDSWLYIMSCAMNEIFQERETAQNAGWDWVRSGAAQLAKEIASGCKTISNPIASEKNYKVSIQNVNVT